MIKVKNNKKGFTLLELVIAIGLLSLFAVFIGVSLNRTFKKQKENDYNNFIKKIVASANLYVSNEGNIINSLSSNKGYIIIKVKNLIDKGLLSENTINPKTNEKVDPNDDIKVSYDSNGTIKIEYPTKIVTEDYLQALDIYLDFGSDKSNDYCYQGLDTPNLIYVTAEGNFVKGYLKNGTNITCEGEEKINSNKLGTYRLIYNYVLRDGSLKRATRKVVVVDNHKPTCEQIDAPTSWINTKRTLNVKCNDIGTGCQPLKVPFELENYADNYKYIVLDKAGNTGYCYLKVYSDTKKPECSSTGGSTSWINTPRELTLKCSDSLSGCSDFTEKKATYSNTSTSSFTVKDKAGNENTCQLNIYSDTKKPECSYSGENNTWTNKIVTITQKCTDQEGLSGCLIPSENKNYSDMTSTTFTVKDRAGNTSNTCTVPIYSDITAPTCTNSNQNTTWTNKKINITTTCSDNLSGCVNSSMTNSYENFKTKIIEVKDKAGNIGTCTANIYSDTKAPTCTNSNQNTKWTNKQVTITTTCEDNLSGCVESSKEHYYKNTKVATVEVKDKAGNVGTCSANIYADTTVPTCTNSNQNTKWTNKQVTITTTCEDNLSGCVESSKEHYYKNTKVATVEVKDNAGNIGTCSANIYADTTAPTCTNSNQNTKWTNEQVTITTTCKDNLSGCVESSKKHYYQNTKIATVEVKDNAGNVGTCKANIYADTTAPTAYISSSAKGSNKSITLTGKGTDTLSGIVAYQFSTKSNITASSSGWNKIKATNKTIVKTKTITDKGSHTYYFYTKDAAGNVAKSKSISIKILTDKYYCWYIAKDKSDNCNSFKTVTKYTGDAGKLNCRSNPWIETNPTNTIFQIPHDATIKSATYKQETEDSSVGRTYGWYQIQYKSKQKCYSAGYWIVEKSSYCGSYVNTDDDIMPCV